LWAERLAHNGRPGPADALIRATADFSRRHGAKEDLAYCDRLLGRLALAAGNTAAAGQQLRDAAACFREGDYLTELRDTLPDLASWAQADGIGTPPNAMSRRRLPSRSRAG
jgi:hypothetical protein